MRVAVVTPYYREPDEVLRQCLESVAAQEHPVTHILVADGHAKDWAARSVIHHVSLPGSGHGDNGNLGRAIGSAIAISEGYDAIALIDADNWFRPDHISTLLALHQRTGAALCTSGRSLHRMDGSLLKTDDVESDGVTFVDTSCLLYLRPSFGLLPLWGQMPRKFGPICDRIMWAAVQSRKVKTAHSGLPTMAFRTCYCNHYKAAGEAPPAGCKAPAEIEELVAFWNALPEGERARILFSQ
jgi:glycosyltransferase involved in cell wall biosynthesis